MIMKRNILFMMVCLSVLSLKAQKNYHFSAKVLYNMYLNFGQQEEFKAQLLYSDKAAFFTYKATDEYSRESIKDEDVTEISFSVQDTTTHIYWSDRIAGEAYEKVEISKKHKLLTEPLDTIHWEICNETKQIDTYACYKATCHYRGRNYTAWFTPDIACTWGPWKLQGLPGAILEAYDDKNEVAFYATGVVRKDTTICYPDKPYEKITRKEYVSLLQQTASDIGKRLGSRTDKGFKIKIATPKIYGIEIYDED